MDIAGQIWPGNTRLCTLLKQTVIRRSLPPSWPKLSQIAWVTVNVSVFLFEEEAFPGNT